MKRESHPGRLRGRISLPGDKSISHRALILNALAHGKARISNFLDGEDCLGTLRCLQQLGLSTEKIAPRTVILEGAGLEKLKEPEDVLYVGNSGTTIRLLMGVLSGLPGSSVLTGDASILRRPMGRVAVPLQLMGARIIGRKGGTLAPLAIQGGSLTSLRYETPVASAQLKSAILLAGLFAEGITEVVEPLKSRDHTERMLQSMGARLWMDGNLVALEGRPRLQAQDIDVPGDISGAAFWLVGATILPFSELFLENVGLNPTRTGILDALREMGAKIEVLNPRSVCGEPVGDLLVSSAELKGISIGGELIPRLIDEIPILALAAACAQGRTVIRDAGELRLKESDRLEATATQLNRLGAKIEVLPDGLIIDGPTSWLGGNTESFGDHRLAMTMAIAGLLKAVTIEGTDCTETSYPGFWETLEGVRA
ncbi:MAG TPA: 3-phosphoshikimate 1-carboxyvinyltransferase [Chroococcales cyanobacterium]|jgi:3-phosphoshikimate 1-carboxyvinyltransferase